MINPIDFILKGIEKLHSGNPDHYFTIRGYKVCARCSGMLLSMLILYPIAIYLYMTIDSIPFYPVFFLSLFLGTICLVNWYIGQWKEISNESRFISGVAFSTGAVFYLFLLPEDSTVTFSIKYVTLPVYFLFAFKFILRERRKKNDRRSQG